MKGYPKNLNTKFDYLYVKENFKKDLWEKDFQNLLDTRMDWFFVKNLDSQEEGRMTALNNDKYNILKQRNWRCDISAARKELGFNPLYDLPMGVNETIDWYLENEWLK